MLVHSIHYTKIHSTVHFIKHTLQWRYVFILHVSQSSYGLYNYQIITSPQAITLWLGIASTFYTGAYNCDQIFILIHDYWPLSVVYWSLHDLARVRVCILCAAKILFQHALKDGAFTALCNTFTLSNTQITTFLNWSS